MLLLRKSFYIAIIVLLISLQAPAQKKSKSPGGGQQTTKPAVIVSGRVVLEDGSQLPEPAKIERVCGSGVQHETDTDARGNFSFPLRGESGGESRQTAPAANDHKWGEGVGAQEGTLQNQDAIAPTWSGTVPSEATTERDLQVCELRASLRGFRPESLSLTGRLLVDGKAGTLVLHREVPKGADKVLLRGRKAAAAGNLKEAQKQLEEAVRIYPKFAEAWVELGVLHDKAKRPAEAQKAFEQALAAAPNYIPALFHLAVLAADGRQWERVAEITDKALALNSSDYPGLYFYNAAAYLNLRKLDRAEVSARAARRLDPEFNFPVTELLLSEILAQRLDYNGAAEQLRIFLQHAPNAPQAAQARAQLANIESRRSSEKR